MEAQHTFLAPAKINLFLHVTGQRPDGYHQLQTLFQYLNYGDTLTFQIQQTPTITRIDNHLHPLPQNDLCIQAANLLKQHTKNPHLGATITLNKIIPPGTGLGAGSSNAATTLLALNKLWHLNLPKDTLLTLGKSLGADVPIFLYGQSAWAEGIGDQLTPYAPKQSWHCILLPNAQVPTDKIFKDPNLKKDHPKITQADYQNGHTKNHLEAITTKHYPPVKQALNYLNQHAPAKMSGTGAAVFAPFESQQAAQKALKHAPKDCQGFTAYATNQHPAKQLFSNS